MFWVLIYGPAVILFVIPCLLSWRWLGVFSVLASGGLAFLWQNSLAHRGEGNGVAEAFALMSLYAITAAVPVGIATRALMLRLRRWKLRWRYAWLPAPIALAGLIATPFAMEWYQNWTRRPPSDACLAAPHPITLAGRNLRIPIAPVIVLFGRSKADNIYSLGIASSARAFCARATDGAPVDIRLLWLKFEPYILRNRSLWSPVLCDSVAERPWLHAFCAESADMKAEHYPQRLALQSIDDASRDPSFRDLLPFLRSTKAANDAKIRRLEAAPGPLIVFCKGGAVMCRALFEPRAGLVAEFQFVAEPDQGEREAVATAAKITEIIDDVFGRE
jgi:hypothetical protein